MKKIFLPVCFVIILFHLESCTVAKLSGRGASPLILNQPQAKVNVVQRVEASKQLLFDYTGAIDVSEVLKDVMIGGDIDAIIDITITVKQTVGDFFINLITLGLANARTFVINGDAVKAPKGLGSLIDSNTKPVAVFNSLDKVRLPSGIVSKAMVIKNNDQYFLYNFFEK